MEITREQIQKKIDPRFFGTRVKLGDDEYFVGDFSEKELGHIYYGLTASKNDEYLILESPTLDEVDEFYNPGDECVSDDFILEAITISKFAKADSRMAALVRVLNKHLKGNEHGIEALPAIIGKPKKSGMFAYVTTQVPFSDGQSVSMVFHSPEGDKKKIGPSDEVIAFRWLLNKRDITQVVAPENGADVSLVTLGKRVTQLVVKNHVSFVKKQKDAVEEEKKLKELETQMSELEQQNTEKSTVLTDVEDEVEAVEAKIKNTEKNIEKQQKTNADLEAEIAALQARVNAKSVGGNGSNAEPTSDGSADTDSVGGGSRLKLDDVLVEWKPRFRDSVPPEIPTLSAKMGDKVFMFGDIDMLSLKANVTIEGKPDSGAEYAKIMLSQIRNSQTDGYKPERVKYKGSTQRILVKDDYVLTKAEAEKYIKMADEPTDADSVAVRVALELPITDFRPEEMRVVEKDGWFLVQTRRDAGDWITQKEHKKESDAVADAKGWYPDPNNNTKEPWLMTKNEFENQPGILYHGTDAEFDEFNTKQEMRFGVHFGTKETAFSIPDSTGKDKNSFKVIPVKVDVKNPLRLPDLEFWKEKDIVKELNKVGIEVPVKNHLGSEYYTYEDIKKAIEEAGYDGVIYENKYEGGGDSIIAFRPEQITTHKAAIKKALSEGQNVPKEVLADYPDLKATDGESDVKRTASIEYGSDGRITVSFKDTDGQTFEKIYDNRARAEADRIQWEKGTQLDFPSIFAEESKIDQAATEGYEDAKQSGEMPTAVPEWVADDDELVSAYRIGARRYFDEQTTDNSPEADSESGVPEMEKMVEEAARWKGATMKVAKLVEGDKKTALKLSKMTTKGDLDAYLMKKFGIDETTARDVSNELTDKNIPADMKAKIDDFASEPWSDLASSKNLDSDSEIQSLGVADITSVGSENVYVEKEDGTRYFFKPGDTSRFEVGSYDFSNEIIFNDGTGATNTEDFKSYDKISDEKIRKLLDEAKQLFNNAKDAGLNPLNSVQFMKDVNTGNRGGFSVADFEKQLKEDEKSLKDLESGKIRANKIIGTGGRKPQAIKWLQEQIEKTKTALENDGFVNFMNIRNYISYLNKLINGEDTGFTSDDELQKEEQARAEREEQRRLEEEAIENQYPSASNYEIGDKTSMREPFEVKFNINSKALAVDLAKFQTPEEKYQFLTDKEGSGVKKQEMQFNKQVDLNGARLKDVPFTHFKIEPRKGFALATLTIDLKGWVAQSLDSDAEIQALGVAEITSVGSENVYVEKEDGKRYYFKPGDTSRFEVGPYDFSNEVIFDDGTATDTGSGGDVIESEPWMMEAKDVRALPEDEFQRLYNVIEGENYHSENLFFLAKRKGTDADILEAEDIWDRHEQAGELTPELAQRRDALNVKLSGKATDTASADDTKPEQEYLDTLDAIISGDYDENQPELERQLDLAADKLEEMGLMDEHEELLNKAADKAAEIAVKNAKGVM